MTPLTVTELIERTLYHGTLRDHQDSIRRHGIQPSIGSFVKDSYGLDYDLDDDDFKYHHGDQEAVFAADRNEIGRALGAITHHVSKKLNKFYGDVTWKDVHNHGLLAKIENGDEYMRKKLPHDHPDAAIELEDGVPVAAEPGDYYSTDAQSGDKLLTGSSLLRKFKRHGFKTDHHAKVVDTQRLVTPTDLSRRQQKKARVAARDPQLKFSGKGFYESTATELIEAKLGDSVGHAQKPTKLGAVTIDNRNGLGATPDNMNIGYRGFTVHMKPSDFLNLNPERGEDKGIGQVEKHIRSGGSIGSPFLNVEWDTEDKSGDLSSSGRWRVTGHEGRARMLALHNMQPDVSVPVHVFPRGEIRARHLRPQHTSARIHPDTRAKTGRVHTPTQVTHTPDHI